MALKQGSFLLTKKGKTVSIIVVVSIILAGAYAYYSNATVVDQTASGAQIRTEIVRRGDLTLSASGTGTLVAQSDASFGFESSGPVTAVYIKVGDEVQLGQVLAQQDDTLAHLKYAEAQQSLLELYSASSIAAVQQEIAAAQDTEYYAREWLEYLISPEVLEAEENLAIAQQRLVDAQEAAKTTPSDAVTQVVKEKEKVVVFLTDKLEQAQDSYKSSYLPENFGEYENIGSKRHQHLVLVTYIDPYTGQEVPEINGPSIADIAIARNHYIQAQETANEGAIYLESLNTGVIPEDATGEKLTTLYQAQLALENARAELDATQLIAPISGTVTAFDLNIGEQAGTESVITISQLTQPYVLDVYLDEADWDMARAGNKVNVVFDLLPEQTYAGSVSIVYPELNPSFESSLVHIIVQLDSSISQELPAGTGATVAVIGGETQRALLISVDAVHKGDDGKSYVTVIQNGEQLEREVQVGLLNDTYAEIISGLEAGETVVTE